MGDKVLSARTCNCLPTPVLHSSINVFCHTKLAKKENQDGDADNWNENWTMNEDLMLQQQQQEDGVPMADR